MIDFNGVKCQVKNWFNFLYHTNERFHYDHDFYYETLNVIFTPYVYILKRFELYLRKLSVLYFIFLNLFLFYLFYIIIIKFYFQNDSFHFISIIHVGVY